MVIAVCDDEKQIQGLLEEKVRKMLPQSVIYTFSSGDELLRSEIRPDILFLDIQMPGTNGMDTAKEIRKKQDNIILIFVTAIEEYVFQAFDVGAFHYLVKPFSEEKFAEVLEKAIKAVSESKKEKENDDRYIMIQYSGSHRKIYLKDIVYAEVFNRKVVIHTLNRDFEYYGKLQDLCRAAGEDFYRTHRAYLINMNYVEGYDSSHITLSKGEVLIAKAQYADFVKTFLAFNRRGE